MPPQVIIRLARRDEQKALEELQREASLVWEENREALLAHPDAIALPLEHIDAGRAHVAERFGQILGFSVVLSRPDGDAELDGLFVEPAHWRQGIGRHLVQEAGRLAASEGSALLCVVAHPRTLGFYTACGFDLAGEATTRFGPGLIMRKRLAGAVST